jgi:mannose-6-phosphate isomerase-like protein (cupin superfamily)
MQVQTTDIESIRQAAGTLFEGAQFGGVPISFFVVDASPGGGPSLHVHPYEEIFVVQEGEAIFTINGQKLIVRAGQIVVAPREQPHKFINSGTGRLRSINIHPSERVVQRWIEEGS